VPDRFYERLERELRTIEALDKFRSLQVYPGIDFGSNDYLGFAVDAELRARTLERAQVLPNSASSSRLLPGYHAPHRVAEERFAAFMGTEAALFFNSGYDANMALLTTLPNRHDRVLYDERCHASIYDGVRAGPATSERFKHSSPEALRDLLNTGSREGACFIVLESVYSMDGDIAPIAEFHEIAKAFDAMLIVDEAHATGVLGNRGAGLVSETLSRDASVISMHTCGKALGAAGAFVAANRTVVQYLINKARPFIFTTASPPIIPALIVNVLERLSSEGTSLVETLKDRSRDVRESLKRSLKRWSVPHGITPIVPIIIGPAGEAMRASELLRERGFEIPAVRPPSVPEGTSRLRMNISLRHSEQELKSAIRAISEVEEEVVG